MKRTLLVMALAAIGSTGLFAQQSYYYEKSVGTTSEYDMNTTGTTIISGASGGTNNVLSSTQTLPFTNWTFFGNTVTDFKVSSSGYITFDVSQTSNVTDNTSLPNAGAPKNAIFAFWDNLKFEPVTSGSTTFPSDVKSFTYGTAPNRVFVVQWRLASKMGQATLNNVTYFATRIYEAGGFDIVENYGFGTFNATIGVSNSDGTLNLMVGSSPASNFGGNNGSYDPSLSDVYTFKYATDEFNVVAVSNKTLPVASTSITAGIPVSVEYGNHGYATITSAKLNYSVDGGAVVSQSVTVNMPTSGVAVLSSPVNYVPTVADEGTNKTIIAWLSELNGGAEYSDSITIPVFVNAGITGTKRVLLEEGSGAWCGWCPDGHLILRDILESNSMVVGVVHHNGDAMTNTESDLFNGVYGGSYPYGTVDRMKFADQGAVALNRGDWATKVTQRLTNPTPVNISIQNRTYTEATHNVTYDVKVDFVDYPMPGDIRVSTFIVEDQVRGKKTSATSTQYNQHSYLSQEDPGGGIPGHELYEQPDYFYGYYHNHVVRAVPSGIWGTTSGIPSAPAKGSSYTQSYNYTLPAIVNLDENVDFAGSTGLNTQYQSTISGAGRNKPISTRIVAIVSYYNADAQKREILNVVEAGFAYNTGIAEKAENNASINNVYPNPATGITEIEFTLTSTTAVTAEIIDVVGKKVMDVKTAGSYATGAHAVYFNANDLKNGIYFITIKTNEGTATKKFVVSN